MDTVQIIGRLTKDPEWSQTRGGTDVCKLRLAVPRPPRGGRERSPVYVDVTVYGGRAEPVALYMAKGRLVAVSGRLDYAEWKAKDGSPRSKHEVVADRVEFLDSPKDRGAGDADQQADVA